ncbi:MAG: ComF family protein [Lachnospiraceae bacterium]|nr:ComF family protein [Lachnospiraceae bacterium]
MFLNMLFPRRCPICSDIAMPKGELVCSECVDNIPYIRGPRCYRCGKELRDERTEYCFDCSKHTMYYERGVSLFRYNQVMRRAMDGFKYKNRREYADFFTTELIRVYGDVLQNWEADAVIPIPIHKSRWRIRGYNQAELLAEPLGKFLQIPMETKLIVRTRKTKPQNKLNDKERQKNIEGAFKIQENVVQLKKVILVDDIYTTGSTINACAKLLREAGVEQVYFACICIGSGY